MNLSKNILSNLLFHFPIKGIDEEKDKNEDEDQLKLKLILRKEFENNINQINKKIFQNNFILFEELNSFLKDKNLRNKPFLQNGKIYLLKFNKNDIFSLNFDNYGFVFYENLILSRNFNEIFSLLSLKENHYSFFDFYKNSYSIRKLKLQVYNKILLKEIKNPNGELFFLKDNVFITGYLPRLELMPISIFDLIE